LSSIPASQEKIILIQEEIKALQEELAKMERTEQQLQVLQKEPLGIPGSSK